MSQPKRRILCVDDDYDTCVLTALILTHLGYEVISAKTISEAESLIRSDSFVLYMIDESLPDGSGNDLCCNLRGGDLQTPILIHSGAAAQSDIDAAMEAGATAYLIKPHGWIELEEIVERLTMQNRSTE